MPERIDPPRRDPKERIKDFDEVSLGYTSLEMAKEEASRCLGCNVCQKGCPVEINIAGFIMAIREGNLEKALSIIRESSYFPAICGRVCPQEDLCEGACVLGRTGKPVAIGALERFVGDWAIKNKIKPNKPSKKLPWKVAIVGSGPAGLACAQSLAVEGISVTIFEALHEPGGVLKYGIPRFRLPDEVVENEIRTLIELGVEIKTDYFVGSTLTLKDLLEEFDAVFLATGAGLPSLLGIPGENLKQVYSANEFLTRVNLMQAYKFPEGADTPVNIGRKVGVIGGGNVALDAARSALRFPHVEEVYILYRRRREFMPARDEEIRNAEEEGVKFVFQVVPKRIVGDEDGNVIGIELLKTELGEPDPSGRRRPHVVPGSEFFMEIDTVIVAIGQVPNTAAVRGTEGILLKSKGTLWVDSNGMTSVPGVFAGGDVVTGAATVIEAMGAGKKVARKILDYLRSKK